MSERVFPNGPGTAGARPRWPAQWYRTRHIRKREWRRHLGDGRRARLMNQGIHYAEPAAVVHGPVTRSPPVCVTQRTSRGEETALAHVRFGSGESDTDPVPAQPTATGFPNGWRSQGRTEP